MTSTTTEGTIMDKYTNILTAAYYAGKAYAIRLLQGGETLQEYPLSGEWAGDIQESEVLTDFNDEIRALDPDSEMEQNETRHAIVEAWLDGYHSAGDD